METLKNTIIPYAALGALFVIGFTRVLVEGYFWINREMKVGSVEYIRIYYNPISTDVKMFWFTFITLFVILEIPIIYMNSRMGNPVSIAYNVQNKISMHYEQHGAFRQLNFLRKVKAIPDLGKPQK